MRKEKKIKPYDLILGLLNILNTFLVDGTCFSECFRPIKVVPGQGEELKPLVPGERLPTLSPPRRDFHTALDSKG